MGYRAFVLVLFGFIGPLAGPASAQPAAGVQIPPIEIATAFSYDLQRRGTSDLPGGAGVVVAVDGNLNDYVAIATELSESPRMRSAMVGGRLSTGYFQEGRGFPGRFFIEALGGVHEGSVDTGRATFQIGGGADVILVPRGVSLHWALDYEFMPSAPHEFAGGRFSVGIVVGPRLRRHS